MADTPVRSVFLGTVKGLGINILLIGSWPLQGRGLACSIGGPCTARCWQSAVIFHQLHFIIPSGLPLPIDGKQCVITCNWLQITLPSLCKPRPITTWPRLPSGPLGPLAAFLGGPPAAWSTMVILSSWRGVGERGPVTEGYWLITNPRGWQVQNSYFVGLVSAAERWPSPFPSWRTRWVLGF